MSPKRKCGPIGDDFRVANLGIFVETKIWRVFDLLVPWPTLWSPGKLLVGSTCLNIGSLSPCVLLLLLRSKNQTTEIISLLCIGRGMEKLAISLDVLMARAFALSLGLRRAMCEM
jgi:hypothetical protein